MLQTFDERNRDLIVSVGGRLSHRDEAGVSPFDSAVQGGDAVWEGLRLYNGRIFRLTEHLARLRRSARALERLLRCLWSWASRRVRGRSRCAGRATARH